MYKTIVLFYHIIIGFVGNHLIITIAFLSSSLLLKIKIIWWVKLAIYLVGMHYH